MDFLIIIAYIVYVGIFGNAEDSGKAGIVVGPSVRLPVNQLMPSEATIKARNAFKEKYCRKRIEIDEAERLELTAIFDDVKNAYTNYQVQAMSEAMANVSNRIDRVQNQLFMDLHWGLYKFFVENFIHGARRRQFDMSADFERFLAAHIKMAVFLGECYCRRNDYYDARPMLIEANAFDVLKTCIDSFHRDGKRDFEEIAQKYMGMWINHIESDQGFTRRYAHWVYDDTMSLIGMGRGRTRERAVSGARGSAQLLIRYGYTPKWLDEFK